MIPRYFALLAVSAAFLLTGCPQPPAASGDDPRPDPLPDPTPEVVTGDLKLGLQDWPRNTWRVGSPLAHERAGLSAGSLGSHVFAIGGDGEATLELLDPATGHWRVIPLPVENAPGPSSRYFGAAVTAWNRLFYIGGTYNWIRPLVDIYDPTTQLGLNGKSGAVNDMVFARMAHAAVVLDEEILVIGGLVASGEDERKVPTDGVAALHPGSRTETLEVYTRTRLATPRAGHGAGAIDGHVYVTGGYTDLPLTGIPEATSSLLRFHANGWHATTPDGKKLASLNVPRHSFGAAVLDGKLYVAGGVGTDGVTLDSVEAYDPATNRWTPMAPMIAPRAHLGLAAHAGHLFAVGGYDPQGLMRRDVNVFRP
ncbi:N-acetylneuraminate epimerase [compost metagenome]